MRRNGSLDRYRSADLKALCSLSLKVGQLHRLSHSCTVCEVCSRCEADPMLQVEYFPVGLTRPSRKRPTQKMFGKGRGVYHIQSRPVGFQSLLLVWGARLKKKKAPPPLGETRRAAVFSLNFGQSQLRLKRKHLYPPKQKKPLVEHHSGRYRCSHWLDDVQNPPCPPFDGRVIFKQRREKEPWAQRKRERARGVWVCSLRPLEDLRLI